MGSVYKWIYSCSPAQQVHTATAHRNGIISAPVSIITSINYSVNIRCKMHMIFHSNFSLCSRDVLILPGTDRSIIILSQAHWSSLKLETNLEYFTEFIKTEGLSRWQPVESKLQQSQTTSSAHTAPTWQSTEEVGATCSCQEQPGAQWMKDIAT